jgi:hypothetical protein
MNRKHVFALIAAFLAFHAPLLAAEPGETAEKFYAGYVGQVDAMKDTGKWVAASDLVTAKFKKAYAEAMNAESLDADPILNAQDVPSKPFKAVEVRITGDTATVWLETTYGDEKHGISASLVKTNGIWLLDSVK